MQLFFTTLQDGLKKLDKCNGSLADTGLKTSRLHIQDKMVLIHPETLVPKASCKICQTVSHSLYKYHQ